MVVPFSLEVMNEDGTAFNRAMSKARVVLEWMFKEVKTIWNFVDNPRKQRFLKAPIWVTYMNAMLLMNMRTCYGNQVSRYFDLKPPTLAEYINSRG